MKFIIFGSSNSATCRQDPVLKRHGEKLKNINIYFEYKISLYIFINHIEYAASKT